MVYTFTFNTAQRIIRAANATMARAMAIAAFGPQAKAAPIAVYANHLAPTLTGQRHYDKAARTLECATSGASLRAMQRGGMDYLRAMYNPHDPIHVQARAESMARKALAMIQAAQE
jgi:hypothetical protein